MEVLLNERASADRPAWSSVPKTGGLNAHKHKHTIVNGRFRLLIDYYKHRKIVASR